MEIFHTNLRHDTLSYAWFEQCIRSWSNIKPIIIGERIVFIGVKLVLDAGTAWKVSFSGSQRPTDSYVLCRRGKRSWTGQLFGE